MSEMLRPARVGGIIKGDALEVLKTFPDGSVHCVITSPPYWGLRDYGEEGQIGLEATPQEHIARLMPICKELWRVLRSDGQLWWNYGDCYAQGKYKTHSTETDVNGWAAGKRGQNGGGTLGPGLKPKDLVGMPWRTAFALQGWAVVPGQALDNAADLLAEAREKGDWEMVQGVEGMLRAWAAMTMYLGPYWLRSDIIWAKSNPMPESVTDRPARSHEYIFLLTKAARYFYDADAVREKKAPATQADPRNNENGHRRERGFPGEPSNGGTNLGGTEGGRNQRSVWEFPTAPYPGAHFATFPPKLVERCIKAGTSEKGVCPKCGGPWKRVLEGTGKYKNAHELPVNRPFLPDPDTFGQMLRELRKAAGKSTNEIASFFKSKSEGITGIVWNWENGRNLPSPEQYRKLKSMLMIPDDWDGLGQEYCGSPGLWGSEGSGLEHGNVKTGPSLTRTVQTLGFRPSCECDAGDPVPALVLDPFAGSGTTGVVCAELGRDFIGIDLAGGDKDLGGHTANERIEAARNGISLSDLISRHRDGEEANAHGQQEMF